MRKTFAVLATTGAAVAMIAGSAAIAQTSIGDLTSSEGISIEGRVTDVFGNKFVLEDDTGRVLVETGPSWWRATEVSVGDELTVIGENDGPRLFDAFTIRYEDGREVKVRDPNGPPPWAGQRGGRDDDRAERGERRDIGERAGRQEDRGPRAERSDDDDRRAIEQARGAGIDLKAIVEEAGYTFAYDVDRKKEHYEVEAYDANGAEVELHIDMTGNIRRVEMDEPQFDEAGLRKIVEDAGYEWRGDVDRKKRHVEVDALNRHGEEVELHVDYAGEIYKEKWDD